GHIAHTVALGRQHLTPGIAPHILSRRALHRAEGRVPRAWNCTNHLPRRTSSSVRWKAPRAFGRAGVAMRYASGRAGME
ncbi:hypothetical protein HAX54_026461, partial [Datura stramonium]|nr:hypothetical protein [Datura stramonium]